MKANIERDGCKKNEQLSTILRPLKLMAMALSLSVSIWNAKAIAQQRCENIFSNTSQINPLLHYSGQHFDLFILGTMAKADSTWWNEALRAIADSNSQKLASLYKHAPQAEHHRSVRLLMLAEDHGLQIPQEFSQEVSQARLERSRLRNQDMEVEGNLTTGQMKDLTNMFTMLGIRRSKAERLYERLKNKFGMESAEYIPVIQANKVEDILGDEARLALQHYNQSIVNKTFAREAYKELMENLFSIYSQRVYQNLSEPWFTVDGKNMNLNDFINSGAYRQQEIKSSNTWMNVARLDPEKVQNPIFKGHVREMWWNRLDGINPIGTVRISRNMLVAADGTEKLVSVEVLRRGDEGFFVPYLFEADITGKLQLKEGRDGMQSAKSCFQCHLRLSGVFFGGITMPNYKAVNDWHINNIDFTKRSSYEKFNEFR